MRHLPAFLLVATLGLAPPAMAAEPGLDEATAVERFALEAPRAAAIRRQVEVARAEVVAARALPNPTVDVGREQVFSPGGPAEQHRLGVAATLPLLGQRAARIAIAEAGAEAVLARAEGDLAALTRALRAAFTRASLADRRVQALEGALGTYRRLERVVEARRRAGESAGYEVLRLSLARAGVEAQAADARARARMARGELAGLLGRPLSAGLHPRPLPSVPDEAALVRAALAGHPELRVLRAEQSQARAALQLAERLRWADPQVALGLKQTNEPTVQGFGYTAGLSWPMPLLDQGQGAIARARADLARVDAEEQALTARLQAEVPPARAGLVDRLVQLARYRADVLARVPRVLRVAEVAYQEGDQGLVSLLDAHQAARDASLQGLDLEAAARDALLDLERLTGAPVVTSPRSTR